MKNRFIHILIRALLCLSFVLNASAATQSYLPSPIKSILSPPTKRFLPFRYKVIGVNNDIIKKNINLTLLNLRSSFSFPMTEKEMDHFIKKAPKAIQTAVEPYGYFRSQVESSLVKKSDGWYATLYVNLGPALPIRSVQVEIKGEGKTDPKYVEFLKKLPFKIGAPLQTEMYDTEKARLYDIATERGYFNASMLKSQIRINLTQYYARIIFIFDTGKRFRFGPTTFTKTPFYDSFLQRFLAYKKGDYFDAKKLEKTQFGLVSSNYFDQALITPEPKKAVNGYVPIKVSLILRKRKAYLFGVGYGTDTGPRATLGLSVRRIGHEGHRFHTILRGSQYNSSLTAKYIIPGWHPANQLFTIGAGGSYIKQSTGTANNAKFAVSYTILSDHWNNSFTLGYLNERYHLSSLPSSIQNLTTNLVSPTFETKYTNADHKTHPKKGITATLQLTGADKNILSKTDFFQVTLHVNTLYTINKTNTRLLFRSDLGHTDIANIDNLPLSLQLFAGGSESVRGYPYNSIGIYGSNNPGRNMVVASTEVQQKIIGAFYLAGFIDAGVVANNHLFHHINAGTGPGIAWISPIGTVELTVAEAFTQLNKPWTIQFTMGTAL